MVIIGLMQGRKGSSIIWMTNLENVGHADIMILLREEDRDVNRSTALKHNYKQNLRLSGTLRSSIKGMQTRGQEAMLVFSSQLPKMVLNHLLLEYSVPRRRLSWIWTVEESQTPVSSCLHWLPLARLPPTSHALCPFPHCLQMPPLRQLFIGIEPI